MRRTFHYTEKERINFENTGIQFNIEILNYIKNDLKLDETINVQLENYSANEIERFINNLGNLFYDFDEKFEIAVDKNIIEITRIGLNESHKVDIFKDKPKY
ncbi:hypothetical protein ACFFLS_06195 [Flavobacterium procerum]|uniref:Uncharacterized protein n=1 Tax=Flavobacterium procerum TaxID=1455569 RepID=A0ABV6BMF2_9FLAO